MSLQKAATLGGVLGGLAILIGFGVTLGTLYDDVRSVPKIKEDLSEVKETVASTEGKVDALLALWGEQQKGDPVVYHE